MEALEMMKESDGVWMSMLANSVDLLTAVCSDCSVIIVKLLPLLQIIS